ncbi:phosphatase PAP2 family protein [Pseudoalteromonas sp. C2R02]|uniref:phosphatase PAP2 family protein n=1 Tax=Pseudoalteromonas sp. C2R02 TaxID=2841565 RepID=UPI002091AC7D|nr:phosphatase PAP2 family protein [Pseudoalteromonas sp. C2R02]
MKLQHLDTVMFMWCVSGHKSDKLKPFASLISKTGDGYLQVALPILLLSSDKGMQLIIATLIAFMIERPLYWLLKNTLKRNRPPQAIPFFKASIVASDEFSFPSGHTSGAFLLAFLIAQYFPSLSLLIYIWASCVGISRVLLGVHFPTDILAGAGLGTALGSLTIIIIGQ